MSTNRQPAGIPTGGRFAPGTQARPAVSLDAERTGAMSHSDVISAGKDLDPETIRTMDRAWFDRDHTARDNAVKPAWEVVQGTELEKAWRDTTYLPTSVRFAAIGAATRGLIGQGRYTQAHYDLLTGPWRKTVGPIHPDDAYADDDPGRYGPDYDTTAEEPFNEYGRHELDYDDPRNMDLYDGD